MTPTTLPLVLTAPRGVQRTLGGLSRALLVGLTAFLTVVDLFATQAILPALTRAYGTTPAMMSFAVNASTIGMAVSGLAMSLIGRRIDRRVGHSAVPRAVVRCRRCRWQACLILRCSLDCGSFRVF